MPKFLGSESQPTPSTLYTVRVLDRQLVELRKMSERTGVPLAEQIRRGIDLWIQKQKMSSR